MVIRDGVKIFCRYDILYDIGIRTPQFSLINANTDQTSEHHHAIKYKYLHTTETINDDMDCTSRRL